MKNKDYWQKRMLAYEEAQRNKGLDYLTNLNEQYTMLTSELEKELARWYSRFAKNNEISMVEAKKLLNSQELKEFKWSVKDYIDYGRMNAVDQMWMKQLENASAKVHISRLESIKLQMQQHVEVLYNNQLDDLDGILRDIYQEGYYRTAWEIQRGLNVGYTMQSINENQLDKILIRPWSYDNKTFSNRIWTHKKQLINELETHLVQSVTMGKKPDEAIKKIARFTGTYDKKPRAALYRAGRLVMTESAAFSSMAQEDCFNELGVEKYEIIATLDSHTSKICRGLDKRLFDMTDYKVGQTAPPFHSFCRTVTAPYFDDEFSLGKRAARNEEGQTYYVPSDISYKEWYNNSVVNKSDYSMLIGIKTANDIEIKLMADHLIERGKERPFTPNDLYDALTKPLDIRDVIIDSYGRPSQRFTGTKATVNINPETGKVVTAWKTGKDKLRKYGIKEG